MDEKKENKGVCNNCLYMTKWINGRNHGYCIKILEVLGLSDNHIDVVVYGEVKGDFYCGAYKSEKEALKS